MHASPDRDLLQPLLTTLGSLLSSLLVSTRPNFIAPHCWITHRDALLASLPVGNELAQVVFRSVDDRNRQLLSANSATQPLPRQVLVRLLDATLQTPLEKDFPSRCWDVS